MKKTYPVSGTEVSPDIYTEIRTIVQSARSRVYTAVNTAMVEAYWLIGKRIVEEEQQGKERATYGKYLIKDLAAKLTAEFGKGFHPRNLRNMRGFYLAFPKWNVVRTELSWTHYRALIRIDNTEARQWYMMEGN